MFITTPAPPSHQRCTLTPAKPQVPPNVLSSSGNDLNGRPSSAQHAFRSGFSIWEEDSLDMQDGWRAGRTYWVCFWTWGRLRRWKEEGGQEPFGPKRPSKPAIVPSHRASPRRYKHRDKQWVWVRGIPLLALTHFHLPLSEARSGVFSAEDQSFELRLSFSLHLELNCRCKIRAEGDQELTIGLEGRYCCRSGDMSLRQVRFPFCFKDYDAAKHLLHGAVKSVGSGFSDTDFRRALEIFDNTFF
ncbi:hypothetical protein BDN70DRAFT_926425 [Pholiota conissans]|uniref:Uncharacterized protein n=1 Tax=Pholiota conissans TaxID=109636 RepID=A0A9P6CL00_9AGAR|nr:hypothetical protein BDN70DRAFT_926425 [Pholiota conissans]